MENSSLREKDKLMSAAVTADVLRDECASRFREWVRLRFPVFARKRLAALLGVTPATVNTWLDSQDPRLPRTESFIVALAVFGPEFAAHVLAPCGEWMRSLSLMARVERMRAELEDLKSEISALGPPLAVDSEIRDALASVEEALARARGK